MCKSTLHCGTCWCRFGLAPDPLPKLLMRCTVPILVPLLPQADLHDSDATPGKPKARGRGRKVALSDDEEEEEEAPKSAGRQQIGLVTIPCWGCQAEWNTVMACLATAQADS